MTIRTLALAAICLLAGCGGGNTSVQPIPAPAQQSRPVSDVVAFMGDSITHRWDLTQYDAGPTLNFGVDENTTAEMLARFSDVTASGPGVIVILGGINDFVIYGPTGVNIESIKAMAAQAKAAGILVILCSVMPAMDLSSGRPLIPLADIQSFNDQLIELAQQSSYLYADYYDEFLNPDGAVNNSLSVDGIHPTPAGYARMWEVIAPLLAEDLN